MLIPIYIVRVCCEHLAEVLVLRMYNSQRQQNLNSILKDSESEWTMFLTYIAEAADRYWQAK